MSCLDGRGNFQEQTGTSMLAIATIRAGTDYAGSHEVLITPCPDPGSILDLAGGVDRSDRPTGLK
jgi:hypothetical protein